MPPKENPSPSEVGSSSGTGQIPAAVETKIRVSEDVKVTPPDRFDGTPSKLDEFLMKANVYLLYQQERLPRDVDKCIWFTTRLTGRAYDWISPHLEDFWETKLTSKDGPLVSSLAKEDTKLYFQTIKGMMSGLRKHFGDIDKERKSLTIIEKLKQTGSATQYAAQFQQYTARLGWGDTALRHRFYQGLKEHVKDELYRKDLPPTLSELIDSAIRIDNRHFERKMERGGNWTHWTKKERQGGDPMQGVEYNKMTPKRRNHKQQDKKDTQKETRTCYNCKKVGHLSKDCRSPKKSNQFQSTTEKRQDKPKQQKTEAFESSSARAPTREELARLMETRRRSGEISSEDESTSTESSWTSTRAEEEQAAGVDLPPSHRNTVRDWDNESHTRSEEQEEETIRQAQQKPAVREIWTHAGTFLGGNHYQHIVENGNHQKPDFFSPLLTTGPAPLVGANYRVQYRDDKRIVFKRHADPPLDIEPTVEVFSLGSMNPFNPQRDDRWEKVAETITRYVWEQRTNTPGLTYGVMAIQEKRELALTNTFLPILEHPYSLLRVEGRTREWRDEITRERFIETLGTEVVEEFNSMTNTNKGQKNPNKVTLGLEYEGKTMRVLIDSGATKNFMSKRKAEEMGLQIKRQEPYVLTLAGGEKAQYQDGMVDEKTKDVILTTKNGQMFRTNFEITETGQHDAVLGMTWLRNVNPIIDWRSGEIFPRTTE